MGVFDIKIQDYLTLNRVEGGTEGDYNLMCLQFGKVISIYYLNQELHSSK